MQVLIPLVSITIASLPLYIVRCKNFAWCDFPFPITLLEILILLSFLAWVIWRTWQIKKGQTDLSSILKKFKGPFFLPILLFLLSSSLAVLLSVDQTAAAGIWKAYFLEPALLYIVVLDLSVERKSIVWVINSLLAAGVWLSGLAIWQFLTKTDPFAPVSIMEGRVSAVYNSPNSLALFLGPIILLCFGIAVYFLKKKQFFYSGVYFLIFPLLSSAFFLTQSRGGQIALFFGGLTLVLLALTELFKKNLEKEKKILFLGFLVVYIFASAFALTNLHRLNVFSQDKNFGARVCIWEGTKTLLEKSPVQGIGISSFPKLYQAPSGCAQETFQYPHNLLLTVWVELGIFGLFSFLWLLVVSGRILAREKDFIAFSLLAVFIYLLVHGLVDVPYFKNDLAVFFWLTIGLASWYEVRRRDLRGR